MEIRDNTKWEEAFKVLQVKGFAGRKQVKKTQ